MALPTDTNRYKEIRFGRDSITLEFEEADIDRLALEFCSTLERHDIAYAIVGGYVAILLGRPRGSDDVDVIAEPLTFKRFLGLHRDLEESFTCHTPGDPPRLFSDYLDAAAESTAVRYHYPASFIPNVEFKFARKRLDLAAVKKRVRVTANGKRLWIGPLEMQIGYKLYMKSPKDFEDARWMYRVAEGWLEDAEIWGTARALGVSAEKGRKILESR